MYITLLSIIGFLHSVFFSFFILNDFQNTRFEKNTHGLGHDSDYCPFISCDTAWSALLLRCADKRWRRINYRQPRLRIFWKWKHSEWKNEQVNGHPRVLARAQILVVHIHIPSHRLINPRFETIFYGISIWFFFNTMFNAWNKSWVKNLWKLLHTEIINLIFWWMREW